MTELLTKGSLESVIADKHAVKTKISIRMVLSYATDIARGLNWLHHKVCTRRLSLFSDAMRIPEHLRMCTHAHTHTHAHPSIYFLIQAHTLTRILALMHPRVYLYELMNAYMHRASFTVT